MSKRERGREIGIGQGESERISRQRFVYTERVKHNGIPRLLRFVSFFFFVFNSFLFFAIYEYVFIACVY